MELEKTLREVTKEKSAFQRRKVKILGTFKEISDLIEIANSFSLIECNAKILKDAKRQLQSISLEINSWFEQVTELSVNVKSRTLALEEVNSISS